MYTYVSKCKNNKINFKSVIMNVCVSLAILMLHIVSLDFSDFSAEISFFSYSTRYSQLLEFDYILLIK
jgi:hypothetical protein